MKNTYKTTLTLASLLLATIKRIKQYGAHDYITEYTYFINATPRKLKMDRISKIVAQLNSERPAPELPKQATEPNPGQMLDDKDVEVFQHAGEIQHAIVDMHGNKPTDTLDAVRNVCSLVKNQCDTLETSIAFFRKNLSDDSLFSERYNRMPQLKTAISYFEKKQAASSDEPPKKKAKDYTILPADHSVH